MIQKAYKFDKPTLISIAKGAIIALLPVLCLYLLDILPQFDFGVYTPTITAVASILINTVYQWSKGQK